MRYGQVIALFKLRITVRKVECTILLDEAEC